MVHTQERLPDGQSLIQEGLSLLAPSEVEAADRSKEGSRVHEGFKSE